MALPGRPARAAALPARAEAAQGEPLRGATEQETAVSWGEETAAVFAPLLCPARPRRQ